MKYLNDYIDDKNSKTFEKYGAFFAFSKEQFDEKAEKNTKYTDAGLGLICPVKNRNALIKEINQNIDEGIKQDLKEHGKRAIVVRELNNHEAFYTGSTEDTAETLKDYGIGKEYIREIYSEEFDKYAE